MKNIQGKAYAMNVFTPIKPWTLWLNKLVMWYATLCIGPAKDNDLKRLSFIHFARWVVVPKERFQQLAPSQPKETLKQDYLFFESNFNGTWDQYIDAFSDVLPTGLNIIWYWSSRYPGSRPITPFKDYITHNQVWTDYYFNATPGAATNDVKAGLRFQVELMAFRERSKGLSPEQFRQAYNEFLIKVQGDLGSTGPGPVMSLICRQPVNQTPA